MKAMNVELIKTVLKKGDCTKAREKIKKDEFANTIVEKLKNSSMKIMTTPAGLILET